MVCYIKEYTSECILAEACDMSHSHVRGYSVLNKCMKMHIMNNMKLTVTKHLFCQRCCILKMYTAYPFGFLLLFIYLFFLVCFMLLELRAVMYI